MTSRASASLSVAALLPALLLVSASNAQNVTTYATGVTGAKDLAWDGSGVLCVSGQGGGVGSVYKVGPGGAPVTTFATGFTDPWGLAFGPSGDLFVGEWGPRNLKRVSPAGVVTMHAAGVTPVGENLGGLVITPTGEIYVGSETYIRTVAPEGSPVTIFASGLVSTAGLVQSPEGGFYSGQFSHHDVWQDTAGGVASVMTRRLRWGRCARVVSAGTIGSSAVRAVDMRAPASR